MGAPRKPGPSRTGSAEQGFKLELLSLYVTERDSLDIHDRLLRSVRDGPLIEPLEACREQHAHHVQGLAKALESRDVEAPRAGELERHRSPVGDFVLESLDRAQSRDELWALYEANEALLRRHYNSLLLDPELPSDLRPLIERNAFEEAGHEDFAEDLMAGGTP